MRNFAVASLLFLAFALAPVHASADCHARCPVPALWKRIKGHSPWFKAAIDKEEWPAPVCRTSGGQPCLLGAANCICKLCRTYSLAQCAEGSSGCSCVVMTNSDYQNTNNSATVNWNNPVPPLPSTQCRKWCSTYETQALRNQCNATSLVGNGCEYDVYNAPDTCTPNGACV